MALLNAASLPFRMNENRRRIMVLTLLTFVAMA